MRNDAVFLDTSGWIALLNSADRLHRAAVAAWREKVRNGSVMIVTDWIIAETGNGLARSRARGPFARAVRLLSTSPEFRVVMIDDELLTSEIELYESRPDKSWGRVDCASFVVMTRQGIREALTHDRHFEQAGFHCLLSGPDQSQGGSNGSAR